ncbi:hypothetical protein F383_03949 [Gossypium arboreum]|uniref:Uncharacterized protein n=1 Tax=Gossypium arboreum TaxID=29729 RepID=A0A0B0NTL1_GOSAR|nr:hypothetical protein F383_03949 [Gossypium arboreum]
MCFPCNRNFSFTSILTRVVGQNVSYTMLLTRAVENPQQMQDLNHW